MIAFELDVRRTLEVRPAQNIELICVVNGRLQMTVGDKSYLLVQDDFILINPGERYGYTAEENALLCAIHISREKLCRLLKRSAVRFRCNSISHGGESGYREAAARIRAVLDACSAGAPRDMMELQVALYRLLHTLTTYFLVAEGTTVRQETLDSPDERKQEIEDYIEQNFDKTLRLTELAERLHLSTAYLSKYIKKQFGMSFLDYVNKIRLGRATTELLYSDESIARISMDMGFASLTAFNRQFKETYGVTPSVFRRQHRGRPETAEAPQTAQPADSYRSAGDAQDYPEDRILRQSVRVQGNASEPLEKIWNRLLNAGPAERLLHSSLQSHVLELRDRLGFRLVRFWDLFAPELFLTERAPESAYDFGKLDRILDFLVQNRLTPYLEIGDVFRLYDAEQAHRFLRAFIGHLVNRYGMEAAGAWYYECGVSGGAADGSDLQTRAERYIRCFAAAAGAVHAVLPSARVGGAGLALRRDAELFDQILGLWVVAPEKPGFISLQCFPADETEPAGRAYPVDALHRTLSYARSSMERHGFADSELHVSAWNAASRKLTANDACHKGAYTMKNLLDSLGMADLIGYWPGSDLAEDSLAPGFALDGSAGLLTRGGVAKPALYALSFLNALGGRLYYKGENYAVSNDGYGNWRIVCHNYKNINYRYYADREREVDVLDQDQMVADTLPLHLLFELPAPEDARYRIRVRSLNRAHGSVLDEWLRMGKPLQPDPAELEYLRRVCVPRLTVRELRSQGEMLRFETTMDHSEIQLIQLDLQLDQE